MTELRIEELEKQNQALKKQNRELQCRLHDVQTQRDELQVQVERVRQNPLWKASRPIRGVLRVSKKTVKRMKNLGGPKGFYRKARQKCNDRMARKEYGTKSFPDEVTRKREAETVFPNEVKISILVPLYNTPKNYLKDMIDSVRWQTCGHWELCLADGSDEDHAYVEAYCKKCAGEDARIRYQKLERNEKISGNTNQCLKMATGNYIGLLDHDDILHPSAIYEYMKCIVEQQADYIYCDEGTFEGNHINHFITLHFKPDFAPDNLIANNYICHFSVFKRSLLEGTELFRSEYDGSQDHDMILRLTSLAKNVVHVPRLLYYWRSHKASVASDISAKPYAIAAAKGAVADHLKNQGFSNFEIESTRAFETIFRIRYEIKGEPKVSILIPNKDHLQDLKRCIESIVKKSTYDNYEIIVIENNSTTKEIKEYYKSLQTMEKVRVISYEGVFHYSKINNYGASFANGEYLILLNNDTEVISPDWIEELLMFAQRDDVGAVGAKLYYPDKTIQHAGIVLKLGAHRTAGHVFYQFEGCNLGYMGKLWYQQNVSAVTGACLMVRKSNFDKLNGLSEEFAVSLNDVDFCLRLREAGLLNVFNPYCELYHYESASRGNDVDGSSEEKAKRYQTECDLFTQKWKQVLEKGDPYYNPNFTLDRSDYSLRGKNC